MSDSNRPIPFEAIWRRAGRAVAAALLCGGLVLGGGGAWAEPALTGSDAAALEPPPPGLTSPWLDEVRAQREAWEARRSAVREQHEQRRRIYHPRGSAPGESWEEDLRRRRAARQERLDQDLDAFRRLGPQPWGPPSAFAEEGRGPFARPETEAAPAYPPGWDNLWYFRGY